MIRPAWHLFSLPLTLAVLALSMPAVEGKAETSEHPATAAGDPPSCDAGLLQAQHFNSIELFQSGASCLQSERYLDATFIQALGQIRGSTDVSLLPPVAYRDALLVYKLSARVTYNPQSLGGFGHAEVYRDPATRAELFRRLENWNPSYSKSYSPGWRTHETDLSGLYDEMLGKQKSLSPGAAQEPCHLNKRR